MGNVLSSDELSNQHTDQTNQTNQQRTLSREEYLKYQAYQKEKERQYVHEQQQAVHRNAIANQQNTARNIGVNNTYQAQASMRNQIPDHIPTQFINRPQPSATNVNTITTVYIIRTLTF